MEEFASLIIRMALAEATPEGCGHERRDRT